jgi:hypothetical protein
VKELRDAPAITTKDDVKLIQFLKGKDLIGRYLNELASVGVTGRKTDVLLLLLTSISRLTSTPMILNCIGGQELIKRFSQCILQDSLLAPDHMSDNSVFFFQDLLANKTLLINKDNLAERQLKNMIQLSKDGIKKVMPVKNREGEMINNLINSKGGASLIFYSQGEKRIKDSRVINKQIELNSEDRKKFARFQLLRYTEPTEYAKMEAVRTSLMELQQHLISYPVWIPDLPAHSEEFNTDDLSRLVSIVQSIVILHQYQREKEKVNGISYMVASKVDIELGIELLNEIKKEDMELLTPTVKAIWESWLQDLNKNNTYTFTSTEFKIANKLENRYCSKILCQLEDANLIRLTQRVKGIYNEYSLPGENNQVDGTGRNKVGTKSKKQQKAL